jgi:hypothetical protein
LIPEPAVLNSVLRRTRQAPRPTCSSAALELEASGGLTAEVDRMTGGLRSSETNPGIITPSHRRGNHVVHRSDTHKKKNWLFFGEAGAGERGAILYTVIESCRRRGIDAYAYLKDVLTRLPSMTNRQLVVLLPANWGRMHTPALRAAA